MKRILISAAEPSGDQLGAELVAALKKRGHAEFWGLAGPRMRAAGVHAIARMEDVSAMGLVEIAGKIRSINSVKKRIVREICTDPDAVILIDSPDLHIPLARTAKARGILSIGYVSPQVWAWRPGRIATISAVMDQLLCLFDFEPALYPDPLAHWVGHPVIDRMPARAEPDPLRFGLAPGSRPQETQRHLSVFIETAERVRAEVEGAHFVLVSPVPHLQLPDWIDRAENISDLSNARAVLTKSGTVSLELAVMGVPQVVAHKVHPLTHWLGRRLVRGIEHIAMPNILAHAPVVPEFIQDLQPEILAAALCALPERQPINLSALGAPGASGRAADRVWLALGAA
jgi:lipid-A-disaccharide synthase